MFISSFTGSVQSIIQRNAVSIVKKALFDGDARPLYLIDIEFTPFFCPACNKCYCKEHWRFWDVDDEDGWYDSTRGMCPAKHERMLSD